MGTIALLNFTIRNNMAVFQYSVSNDLSEFFAKDMEFYYEYPEEYKDGVAVDVFTNIKKETIAREREGFKAEIIDPASGKVRNIYVVDMGPSKDGYAPVRFMIDAETFNKTHSNNQTTSALTLGGQQWVNIYI